MKGRVITMGILSFILMCLLSYLIVYLCTDGIFRRSDVYDEVYIRDLHPTFELSKAYKNAFEFFWAFIIITPMVGLASIVMGIVHLAMGDERAREINTVAGWTSILLAPLNWIVCICALVKFRKIEKDKISPKSIDIVETKKRNSINTIEIRNILMGAMSIIAMICLILYIAWLADVEGRRFITPNTPALEMRWHKQGVDEEAAIAELCVGLGAWLISLITGLVHLSKERNIEKELNTTVGVLAVFFPPINWIFCIITIFKMKKQKVNI